MAELRTDDGYTGVWPRCTVNLCVVEFDNGVGGRDVVEESLPSKVAAACVEQMQKDGLQPKLHEILLTLDPAQHLLNLMTSDERSELYELMKEMLRQR